MCSERKTAFQPQNYSEKLFLGSLFQKEKRHYLERSVAEDRPAELHNNHCGIHAGDLGNPYTQQTKDQM